jgi:hypothetical protein
LHRSQVANPQAKLLQFLFAMLHKVRRTFNQPP